MADKREQILDRLFTVLQTVTPVVGHEHFQEKTAVSAIEFYRNRGEIEGDKRPAITMLDADEDVGTQVVHGRGQGGLAAQPVMVTMRPEIFILLDPREPKNEELGQLMNAYRAKVLHAINADAQLAALGVTITYEGCLTDTATGRAMTGQMQIRMAFSYVFKAGDFAP